VSAQGEQQAKQGQPGHSPHLVPRTVASSGKGNQDQGQDAAAKIEAHAQRPTVKERAYPWRIRGLHPCLAGCSCGHEIDEPGNMQRATGGHCGVDTTAALGTPDGECGGQESNGRKRQASETGAGDCSGEASSHQDGRLTGLTPALAEFRQEAHQGHPQTQHNAHAGDKHVAGEKRSSDGSCEPRRGSPPRSSCRCATG